MKKSKKRLNYFEAHPNKRKALKLKYTQGPDYRLRNYKKRFLKAIGAAKEMAPMFGALAGAIDMASKAFGGLSLATAHTSLGRVQIIPHTQFPEVIVLRTGERLRLPPLAPIKRAINFEQLRELNEQHDPGDEHHPKRVQMIWNDEISKLLPNVFASISPDQHIIPVVNIDKGFVNATATRTISPVDIERMMSGTWLEKAPEPGYCKGEVCNRDGCKSLIQEHHSEGGCSCHINPPCSWCETSREYCPGCGWDGREEQIEAYRSIKPAAPFVPSPPKEIQDDGKLYDVVRYFDDVYEGTNATGLTLPAATELSKKLNSMPRHYVSYSVRETGKKY